MDPFPFENPGAIPYTRTGEELQLGEMSPPSSSVYQDDAFFETPILMQGKSPECGGYSLAFALQYLLNLKVPLSGSFAYAHEKTVDGVPGVEGTLIKAIGNTGQTSGTCLNPLFPDDGDTAKNPQGVPTLYQVATNAAITDALARAGWIPLFLNDLSWTGLQSAIEKYKCVIVEAKIGAEWWTSPNGIVSWAENDVLPLRPPAQVVSAHFFTLGGKYDQSNMWFANSWSTDWGHNGFGYFQKNYLPFITNALVLYKAPPSVTTVVNHPSLSQQEKTNIIQHIINDIAKVLGLIKQEAGQ